MRQLLKAALAAALFTAVSVAAAKDDAREALKNKTEQHRMALTAARQGVAARLADEELERSEAWLEQAEESWKRRNLGLATLQLNNAVADLEVANAKVRVDQLQQQKKQLAGEVESIEQTVAQMREGAE